MAAIDSSEATRGAKRRGNEALLGRSTNERGLTAFSDERLPLSCECSRVACSETIWMSDGHFRQIAHAKQPVSLIAPKHVARGEQVIATTPDYLLVSGEAHSRTPVEQPLADR